MNKNFGYYDENNNWVKTKFCFAPCGERCDCMPPNKVFKEEKVDDMSVYKNLLDENEYLKEENLKLKEQLKNSIDLLNLSLGSHNTFVFDHKCNLKDAWELNSVKPRIQQFIESTKEKDLQDN